MTESRDNSTLYILLGISGAVLLTVAAGWFLLDSGEPLPVAQSVTPESPEAMADSPPIVADEPPPVAQDTNVQPSDIDVDLRKARMAADADILVYPAEQSALHFFGRVLAADPRHEVANAELDAVLERVAQTVDNHLDAMEFQQAYDIGLLVAKQRPDHALVNSVQERLNEHAGALVEEAIEHAKKGDDRAATEALAAATALPGRNPDYYSAVAESIDEIRASRIAASRDRQQKSRDALVQERAAWVATVRNAIASGRLIEPPGDNARDLLAQRQDAEERKQQLTLDLVSALVESTRTSLDAGRLTAAESYLVAAEQLAGDMDELTALRETLEDAFIRAEASRVVSTDELVRKTIVTPEFPRRAARRGLSGWVELEFTVTTTGETADIEVAKAEPATLFNQSAIDAVSQWTFEPKAYRGQLIAQRAAVRLKFALQ